MPDVKAITSKDNALLVRLRKRLSDPASYRKTGEVVLEGDHLCGAFLKRGGVAPLSVISEQGWDRPELQALARRAASVAVVGGELMKGLSAMESPAPLLFVLPWAAAGAPLAAVPTVVLDRLQDAGNVGAVLRSAAAFGFRQVVALKGTAALWSPKVLRAGMGAHFALHLCENTQAGDLPGLQLPLIGTSSHGDQSLHEARLPWPCAWLFGHEGQGVSPDLLASCQLTMTIPQPGGEESLNVTAAAAVCLYESARQRLTGGAR